MKKKGHEVGLKITPSHLGLVTDQPPHTKVIARNRPRLNFKAQDVHNNEALANACTNAVAYQNELSAADLIEVQWYTSRLVVASLKRGTTEDIHDEQINHEL